MIKTRLLTGLFATMCLGFAPELVAQEGSGCYGFEVVNYTAGTLSNGGAISADRQHADRALGVPQNDNTNNFVSLGYGGSLTLRFDGAILDGPGKDIQVVETSFASNDCLSDGIEQALIEVSNDGVNFISLGTLCRDGAVDISAAGLTYVTHIRISNDDAATTTPDGYDVDGVYALNGCGDIPQQGCYAVTAVEYYQGPLRNGNPITDPIRIDHTKALGMPENNRSNGADNFFSLGKGGWIILEMGDFIVTDGTPAADLRVYETSWGNPSCSAYPEYADIAVSPNGTNWYDVATVCQSGNISLDLDAAIPGGVHVKYVRIATNDVLGSTDDYFDLDGVEALWGCEPFEPETPGSCFASCVAEAGYVEGTQRNGSPIEVARTDWTKALNAPQMSDVATSSANYNFVSLGYGGSLTLCFDGLISNDAGNDIEIIETTFGNPSCSSYPEYADIYVSADGIEFFFVGTGCHNFAVDFDNAVDADNNSVYLPYVKFVKIVNNNVLSTSPDGYDVDGVRIIASQCQQEGPSIEQPQFAAPTVGVRSFPNPTRGVINFNFQSSITGNATLELFNTAGQRIQVLFDGELESGRENFVSYDMTALPNGIYMTKLTTKNGVATGKVMLAK